MNSFFLAQNTFQKQRRKSLAEQRSYLGNYLAVIYQLQIQKKDSHSNFLAKHLALEAPPQICSTKTMDLPTNPPNWYCSTKSKFGGVGEIYQPWHSLHTFGSKPVCSFLLYSQSRSTLPSTPQWSASGDARPHGRLLLPIMAGELGAMRPHGRLLLLACATPQLKEEETIVSLFSQFAS